MATNQAVVLILGGIACVCDLRTRRIPNLLTFGGAAFAIVYSLVVSGTGGLVTRPPVPDTTSEYTIANAAPPKVRRLGMRRVRRSQIQAIPPRINTTA